LRVDELGMFGKYQRIIGLSPLFFEEERKLERNLKGPEMEF